MDSGTAASGTTQAGGRRGRDTRRSPITTHDLAVAALKVPPKPGGLPVQTRVQMSGIRRPIDTRGEAALAGFPDLVPLAPTT